MAGINVSASNEEAQEKIKELKEYVDKALAQQDAIEKSMANAQDENSLEWYNEVKETFDSQGKAAFANSKGALQGLQQVIDIAAEAAGEMSQK